MDAVGVSEFDTAAVNVVVPQPCVVGVASPAMVKSGKVTVMLSLIAKSTFAENVNVREAAVEVKAGTMSSFEDKKDGTTTAVDEEMLAAGTSTAAATLIATVRMLLSAGCGEELVVTPVATVIVH
jgi:hypothetical protein